ncbi:1-phosphatidylinositol 4,5-bisphosphate phosphodiesterase delta-4-like isoform X2 [Tachypleus tridentatus]
MWVRGLTHFIAMCKNIHKEWEYDRWLKDQFRKADVNGNGSLNFSECTSLLKQLNICMDKKHVKALFDAAQFHHNKIQEESALDQEEFVRFYHSIHKRPEIEQLFKQYTMKNATIMEPEELYIFLKEQQKMSQVTLSYFRRIIDMYGGDQETEKGYLSFAGFQKFLLSEDCNIFNKDHHTVYQDMSQPLSHYFIASSHNTYLLQGQLIGESSVEGYIFALKCGCRCLELDVWNGPNEEPIIYHGRTFTSKILLSDVVEVIKKYAFVTSRYPVILSLENHCGETQQLKMAEHFVNIFGDMLYTTPVSEDETDLPSPEKLIGKILLKGKKLSESTINGEEELLEEEEEAENQWESRESSLKESRQGSKNTQYRKLTQEVSDLVNYVKAVRFQAFENASQWKFYEMSSFRETKAASLIETQASSFVSYNKKHLSRVYPKGLRTDSSNLDPVQFWNVGCQLVALNYQTYDKAFFLNEAKFTPNGKCGYILKPEFLRSAKRFDPNEPPNRKCMKKLTIKIISGQHIPKPGQATEGEIVDPYVIIKVYGHPLDKLKVKTSFVKNNGFNPQWNETFTLHIGVPDLAIIVFTVKDESMSGKNYKLGKYALPFSSLMEGYRHIHLLDKSFQPIIPASLFVHVAIEDGFE